MVARLTDRQKKIAMTAGICNKLADLMGPQQAMASPAPVGSPVGPPAGLPSGEQMATSQMQAAQPQQSQISPEVGAYINALGPAVQKEMGKRQMNLLEHVKSPQIPVPDKLTTLGKYLKSMPDSAPATSLFAPTAPAAGAAPKIAGSRRQRQKRRAARGSEEHHGYRPFAVGKAKPAGQADSSGKVRQLITDLIAKTRGGIASPKGQATGKLLGRAGLGAGAGYGVIQAGRGVGSLMGGGQPSALSNLAAIPAAIGQGATAIAKDMPSMGNPLAATALGAGVGGVAMMVGESFRKRKEDRSYGGAALKGGLLGGAAGLGGSALAGAMKTSGMRQKVARGTGFSDKLKLMLSMMEPMSGKKTAAGMAGRAALDEIRALLTMRRRGQRGTVNGNSITTRFHMPSKVEEQLSSKSPSQMTSQAMGEAATEWEKLRQQRLNANRADPTKQSKRVMGKAKGRAKSIGRAAAQGTINSPSGQAIGKGLGRAGLGAAAGYGVIQAGRGLSSIMGGGSQASATGLSMAGSPLAAAAGGAVGAGGSALSNPLAATALGAGVGGLASMVGERFRKRKEDRSYAGAAIRGGLLGGGVGLGASALTGGFSKASGMQKVAITPQQVIKALNAYRAVPGRAASATSVRRGLSPSDRLDAFNDTTNRWLDSMPGRTNRIAARAAAKSPVTPAASPLAGPNRWPSGMGTPKAPAVQPPDFGGFGAAGRNAAGVKPNYGAFGQPGRDAANIKAYEQHMAPKTYSEADIAAAGAAGHLAGGGGRRGGGLLSHGAVGLGSGVAGAGGVMGINSLMSPNESGEPAYLGRLWSALRGRAPMPGRGGEPTFDASGKLDMSKMKARAAVEFMQSIGMEPRDIQRRLGVYTDPPAPRFFVDRSQNGQPVARQMRTMSELSPFDFAEHAQPQVPLGSLPS